MTSLLAGNSDDAVDVDRRRWATEVADALDELSESEATALTLVYLHALPRAGAAERLNLTLDELHCLLGRGLTRLGLLLTRVLQ